MGTFRSLFRKRIDKMPVLPGLPGTTNTSSKSDKKRAHRRQKGLIPIRLISLLFATAGLIMQALCYKWERQVHKHLWNSEGVYQLIAIIAFAFSIFTSISTFLCWVCTNHIVVTVINVVLDALAMGFLLAVAVLNTIFVMGMSFQTTSPRKEMCRGRVPAVDQAEKEPLPGKWRDMEFENEAECFAFESKVSDLEWVSLGFMFATMIIHFLNFILGVSRIAMRRFSDKINVLA